MAVVTQHEDKGSWMGGPERKMSYETLKTLYS